MDCSKGTWVYVDRMKSVVVGRKDMLKVVADLGTSDLPDVDANGNLIAASQDLYAFAEAFEAVIKGAGNNLCSTASEEERTAFIAGILSAWNGNFASLDKARGGK